MTNLAMRTVVPLVTQPATVGALPMVRVATDPDAVGGEFYRPRRMAFGLPQRETPSARTTLTPVNGPTSDGSVMAGWCRWA